MKHFCIPLVCAALCGLVSSCSSKTTASSMNAYATVAPTVESYNALTMDIDDNPITYTIDISTPIGKAKLNKLALHEAKELVLIEAIMSAQCATLFNPQYTHLVKNGKILRVTVYGYPARYKKK